MTIIKGKSYKCQEGRPWLKRGTVVVVKPGHFAKRPYLCIIVERVSPWADGERIELCTMIPWLSGAVIWPYWVYRISKASHWQTAGFHIVWFFKGTRKMNSPLNMS